jgi:hypothetical protein
MVPSGGRDADGVGEGGAVKRVVEAGASYTCRVRVSNTTICTISYYCRKCNPISRFALHV